MIVTTLALFISAQTAKPMEHPFTVTDDAIIVDAVVNQKKCSFMFDTGYAGVIVIDDSLNLGKPSGKQTLRDFVGEFEANTIPIKSFSIGPYNLDSKDLNAVQMPQGRMTDSYGTHCDGIMGLSTVVKKVTEINFEKKKFIFYPDSYDISKKVPDGKKTFLVNMLPMGHNSIELRVLTSNGKKFTLALDTGNAFYATTHRDVLEETGLWEVGKKPKFMGQSMVASGAVDKFELLLKDLTIFGVPVKESVWDIIDAPSSSAEHSGTVGYQFLKHFNITLDMARRKVWLENFDNKVTEEKPASIGVFLAMDPTTERLRVYRVQPESPAEKAGIQRGDYCLSIDGKEPADTSFKALYKLLQGPKGSKVKLTLSRGGNLMKYEIERDYLFNESK